MIEKSTTLDQRTIDSSGVIHIRLKKQLVEDGKTIWKEYHRFSVMPGADADQVLLAVNANLTEMNCLPVSDDDADTIRSTVATVHTPEIVESFRAFIAESIAQSKIK